MTQNIWFNIKKALSGSLAAVFFVANGALAYSTETNFWASRRAASQRFHSDGSEPAAGNLGNSNGQMLLAQLPQAGPLELGGGHSAPFSQKASGGDRVPFSVGPKMGDWLGKLVIPYGSVREVYLSPIANAPFIVHIQDAHGIEEAQRNISSMIGLLAQAPGINLIGLEGASGSFSLEPYRNYPDPTITKDIADLFLKKGLIAGPEYAGLTLPKSPDFFGTENDALYKSNVQALKTAYSNKDNALTIYASLQKETEKLKEARFSKDLQTFDHHFEAYHSDKEKLAEYVRYLVGQTVSTKTPNLQLLVKALNDEESLDFKRVELERKQMVERLANKLSPTELQDLVAKSVDYRAGRMGYGDYHAHLRRVCLDHHMRLEEYPQLSRYISYVLLADKIDRGALLNEMDLVEKSLPESLAKTQEEKKLVALSFDLTLLGKLLRHEMTMADWTAYEKHEMEIRTIAPRLGALSPALANIQGLTEETLKPYEEFCSFAAQRNNAMADNLLNQMTTTKGKSAVLVAGGFHTEGLSALLRQKQISFVVVTPKITDVPKDNNYLDVLAKDPAPLEQQLAGERIYLSKPIGMAGEEVPRAGIAFEDVAQGVKEIENYDASGNAIARNPNLGENPRPIKIGSRTYYLVRNPQRFTFAKRWLTLAKQYVAIRAGNSRSSAREKTVTADWDLFLNSLTDANPYLDLPEDNAETQLWKHDVIPKLYFDQDTSESVQGVKIIESLKNSALLSHLIQKSTELNVEFALFQDHTSGAIYVAKGVNGSIVKQRGDLLKPKDDLFVFHTHPDGPAILSDLAEGVGLYAYLGDWDYLNNQNTRRREVGAKAQAITLIWGDLPNNTKGVAAIRIPSDSEIFKNPMDADFTRHPDFRDRELIMASVENNELSGTTTGKGTLVIPLYNQFILAFGYWFVGKLFRNSPSWAGAWEKARRDVGTAEFSIFGAPMTEIPGLPGAAWATGGSWISIGVFSFLFALLHHLRPPPNAVQDFKSAKGIGKLGVSIRIVAATLWGTIAQFFKPTAWRILSVIDGKKVFNPGVTWQFLIRLLAAGLINWVSIYLGGDSTPMVLGIAVILHGAYNAAAKLFPRVALPVLTTPPQEDSLARLARNDFTLFLRKLSNISDRTQDLKSTFNYRNFEDWTYSNPPAVPNAIANLITIMHGELSQTNPSYNESFRREFAGKVHFNASSLLVFWNKYRQMILPSIPVNEPLNTLRAKTLIGTTLHGEKVPTLTIERICAVGGFGTTFQATTSDGKKYLVKTTAHINSQNHLSGALKQMAFLINEGLILERLSDQNKITQTPSLISPHYYGFVLTNKSTLALITEFIEGTTVENMLSQGEHMTFSMARELVRQLEVLHSEGVIHRDIKPTNIMIDLTGRPRLVDFGSALVYKDKRNVEIPEEELTSDLAFQSRSIEPNSPLISMVKPQYDSFLLWALFDNVLPFFKEIPAFLKNPVSEEGKKIENDPWFLDNPHGRTAFEFWEKSQVRFYRDVIFANKTNAQRAQATIDWLNRTEGEIEKLRTEKISILLHRSGSGASDSSTLSSNARLTLPETYRAGRIFTSRLFGRAWSDRAIENWFAMFYEAFRIFSPSRFSADHIYINKVEKVIRDIGIGAMVVAGLAVFYFGFGTGLEWLLSDSHFSFAPAFVLSAAGSFLLGFTATIPLHGTLNIMANTLNVLLKKINKTFRIPRLTFQDNRKPYDNKIANGDAKLDGWISILVNAYQGGHLNYFKDQLPLPQDEIEHEFEKIAQDVVLKKISDISKIVPFIEIPAGFGATMIAYENPLLPNIIIKMAKPTRVGGGPINFEKEVLPGYRVAKNRLGGLFAMMVLNNKNNKFPLFIGRSEVKVDFIIIQERLTPVNRVLASIENESDRLRAESHYLEKIQALLEEFNKRGVVELDASPSSLLVNYGLNSHNALTGLDVDGIMTFEEYSAYLDKHGDENGERDKLAKMEKIHEIAVKQGIEPSRVRDIFLDDVQKAQMEYLKGISNSQTIADLEYGVEEITLPALLWSWWNEAVVTAVYWFLGSKDLTWGIARRRALEKIASPGFKWKWAPLTELPFLPGAAVWGGVSSTLGIVGLSAAFSFLHNLSPPENALERFKNAKGVWNKTGIAFVIAFKTIGRTLRQFAHWDAWKITFPKEKGKPRIGLGVGLQFLIRAFVAFWINTWALQFGVFMGDSTLATFAAAYAMHAVYNFLAPYLNIPTLNGMPTGSPLSREFRRIKIELGKVKIYIQRMEEEPANSQDDYWALNDYVKNLNAYDAALKTLANLKSDPDSNREAILAADIERSYISSLQLILNAGQLCPLLKRAARNGASGNVFSLLKEANHFQGYLIDSDKSELMEAENEIQKEALKYEIEIRGGEKISAFTVKSLAGALNLTENQIKWLDVYLKIKETGVTPSFESMAAYGKSTSDYYQKIWEEGLKGLLSDSWSDSVVSREEDGDILLEINNSFFSLLGKFVSVADFTNTYRNIVAVNKGIATDINRPEKLIALLHKMNDRSLITAKTKFYESEPKKIFVGGHPVFAHPKLFEKRNIGITSDDLMNLVQGALKPRDADSSRDSNHVKLSIVKQRLGSKYWAFVRVPKPDDLEGPIFVLWVGTGQDAHGGASFTANKEANDEATARAIAIRKRTITPSPLISRAGRLSIQSPATIPAVAQIIRIVMVSLIHLFPWWGVGRQWKTLTKQEKLEKIINSYAPFVETVAKGVTFWALRYVLMAMGVDLSFSFDFGILALVNFAFGIMHTKVYQRDPATGDLTLSKTTSFATRLSIAIQGMAMDAPLLFSVFSSLLGPLSLILGNAAALGMAIMLHRLNNSFAVGSLSARFGTVWNAVTTAVVSTTFAVVVAPFVMANVAAPLGAFFFVSLVAQFLDPSTLHAFSQNPVSGLTTLIFGTVTNFSTFFLNLGVPAMLGVSLAGGLFAAKMLGKMPALVNGTKKWLIAMALVIGVGVNPTHASIQRVQEPIVATQVQNNPQRGPTALDRMAERATLMSLMDQTPPKSVLTTIMSKLNVPGHYWSGTDFAGVDPVDRGRAIDILGKPETEVKAVQHLGEEIAAQAVETRLTVGMVGFGTEAMSKEDGKTAVEALQGLLKANQPILLLSDNPSGLLDKLGLSDGEKLLIRVLPAHRGMSMKEVISLYGKNEIPLSSIVLASEGAVDVTGTGYQLTPFKSIAVSVRKSIDQWLAVLHAA